MTDFALSGLTASQWRRSNHNSFLQDVVLPMQETMAEIEHVWGDFFRSELIRDTTPKGIHLQRERFRPDPWSRTRSCRHAATGAWVPIAFAATPRGAPRIELRLGYGYWEMGFAFTSAGLPWAKQMACNLLPRHGGIRSLLEPLLGGNWFDWCARDHHRTIAAEGHGIVNAYDPYDANQFFDGISAWDRHISATRAWAWDSLPSFNSQALTDLILGMIRRVYPLILLSTAADPETAVSGIKKYVTTLSEEHPQLLSVQHNQKIIRFPLVNH